MRAQNVMPPTALRYSTSRARAVAVRAREQAARQARPTLRRAAPRWQSPTVEGMPAHTICSRDRRRSREPTRAVTPTRSPPARARCRSLRRVAGATRSPSVDGVARRSRRSRVSRAPVGSRRQLIRAAARHACARDRSACATEACASTEHALLNFTHTADCRRPEGASAVGFLGATPRSGRRRVHLIATQRLPDTHIVG